MSNDNGGRRRRSSGGTLLWVLILVVVWLIISPDPAGDVSKATATVVEIFSNIRVLSSEAETGPVIVNVEVQPRVDPAAVVTIVAAPTAVPTVAPEVYHQNNHGRPAENVHGTWKGRGVEEPPKRKGILSTILGWFK